MEMKEAAPPTITVVKERNSFGHVNSRHSGSMLTEKEKRATRGTRS